MKEKSFCVLAAIAAAWVLPSISTAAEDPGSYPARPVRVVIGFSAGSIVDTSTRVIASKLNENWKYPLIVDNRTGAGGAIAAQIVAGANPDGHTLLSVTTAHVILPALSSKPPYDTRDFAGIGTTVTVPSVLVVSPSLGVKSVKDLVAMGKAKPGQMLFSSGGVGSSTHFAAELFVSLSGFQATHVPFKGVPEALTEAMVGRVHFNLSAVGLVMPLAKAGKVVALAVSPAKRSAFMPEVPTLAEAGVPGYNWDSWVGVFAPAKTPRAIVSRLNQEVNRVLVLPEVKKQWDAMGTEPVLSTPERFDQYVIEQQRLVAKLVKAANIRIE
jgi:tripartite-type tricarboxylate transporter receptor subunit TctC